MQEYQQMLLDLVIVSRTGLGVVARAEEATLPMRMNSTPDILFPKHPQLN